MANEELSITAGKSTSPCRMNDANAIVLEYNECFFAQKYYCSQTLSIESDVCKELRIPAHLAHRFQSRLITQA